ncbi:helix-turn-helix domain-containing protein [Chitinophaga horti]|uniref:Helix-turn-helix domain-containing protein n=1 Tax=Chitinophaga horti TaxID=2920382 RepID=A0ABY6J809_9BACT|nr:helix-turn-helix domain-containing protein [Chitinophaga horti]UYQ94424.1 helix-turn-helix domain-containing protein [Chitinophaga horti]
MHYQEYNTHPDLASIVKCYWTLEVPAQPDAGRQLVLPDGCIEMFFILGDDIKRFTNGDDYLLQPRQMVLGQITQPFYIAPTGAVHTFAIRFYPYGFANFIKKPISELANTETPLQDVFGEAAANTITQAISQATDTQARITAIETFLLALLQQQTTVDKIVASTVEKIIQSGGSTPIRELMNDDKAKRRQLERHFRKHIGISPKQLCKVIRLQATLQMLLDQRTASFTSVAYENEYFDQAHFIKDFKEFTGVTPGEFLTADEMALSSLLYHKK